MPETDFACDFHIPSGTSHQSIVLRLATDHFWGTQQATWDGCVARGVRAAPGVYFTVLRAGEQRDTAARADRVAARRGGIAGHRGLRLRASPR
jgi:hypothetical protein